MINKRIGVIGYGSMGKMLLELFLRSGKIPNLSVTTRTKEKLIGLPDNVKISETNIDLAGDCDIIFICVKPVDIVQIINEIKPSLTGQKHLVSIAGSVKISFMEKFFNGKISRVMPTLISEVNEGVMLVCHNKNVGKNDAFLIGALMETAGTIEEIPENEFEIISAVTSCAPGLIAGIFDEFVKAALYRTSADERRLTDMALKTLYGTAKLFHEKKLSFGETITRVATKGGATEAGTSVLKEKLPAVFDEMFSSILERQEQRRKTIEDRLSGN